MSTPQISDLIAIICERAGRLAIRLLRAKGVRVVIGVERDDDYAAVRYIGYARPSDAAEAFEKHGRSIKRYVP